MAKKTKKNYLHYRISYSQKNDSFSTWIYVGEKRYPDWEDFGLEMEAKCMKYCDEKTGEWSNDTCMIHYTLLTRIRQAMDLGYEVRFHSRPEE